MYSTDRGTGETVFTLPGAALKRAREVLLEGFSDRGPVRVRMVRRGKEWMARLAVAPGWFFYRFSVDGRRIWDRGVGRLRAEDGRPWNLAVITAPAIPG